MKMKINQEFIYETCKTHTLFSREQVAEIVNMAKLLPYFNASADSEAFIDILGADGESAVVVAESFRENSIYKDSYLGDMIFRENEPAVFQTFDTGQKTTNLIGISFDKNGEKILTRQTVLPIKHDDTLVGVLILEKALEYSSKNETAKKDNHLDPDLTETLLSIIGFRNDFEDTHIRGVLVFNDKGYLTYRNNFADHIYKELGYPAIDDFHFNNLTFMHFEDIKDFNDNPEEQNTRFNKSHEENFSVGGKYYRFHVVVTKNINSKVIVIMEDITEIRKYEKEINNYLVSYQEIHHRIKNNLQTVASLLRLQTRSCKDPSIKAIFYVAINRILSIAVTHELLAQKKGDKASILDVLSHIKHNMMTYCVDEDSDVEISVNGEDFYLDSDRSSVVALIVSELIQNSIKYAFPDNRSGKIEVITSNDGDIRIVEVRDDGVGFDLKSVSKTSLGMNIVKSYVYEKLSGKLIMKSDNKGTTISFAFTF